jgi:hypothetical protein
MPTRSFQLLNSWLVVEVDVDGVQGLAVQVAGTLVGPVDASACSAFTLTSGRAEALAREGPAGEATKAAVTAAVVSQGTARGIFMSTNFPG